MKIDVKGIILLIGSILMLVLGFFLVHWSMIGYAIFSYTGAVVLFAIGIVSLINHSNPDRMYESRVREILNTYDSILVSSTVPKLEGRNIIVLDSIDDLVDAQLEIRKPICYQKQSESCSFVLLDDKEAYIYVEKIDSNIFSPVEIELREMKLKNKNAQEMDSEMLREIDKTTIVKLSNQKSYKVSPVQKTSKVFEDEIEVL